MKLYIDGPVSGGEGVYAIFTEDGEELASHFCSHAGFALSDLERRRPERQKAWRERFGEYSVHVVGDGMTHEQLVRKAWERAHEAGDCGNDRCPVCAEATQ